MSEPDDDLRIMPCDRCDGQGFIEHGHPNAPDAEWTERCPSCNGVGEMAVELQPVTETDIWEMAL